MIETVVIVAIALIVAFYVLAPLFAPDALAEERVARMLSEEQELQSQREMALSALRDLEDDKATGKIGEADYLDLKGKLSTRAVDVLKRLDALGGSARPVAVPDPSRTPAEGDAAGL